MSSRRLRSAVLSSDRQDPVAEQLKTAADAHAEAAEAIKIAANALKDTTFSLQKTMKQVSDSVAASRGAAKEHEVTQHEQAPVPPSVPQPAAPIPAADSAGPGTQPGIPPLLVPPAAQPEPPLLGATLSQPVAVTGSAPAPAPA